MKTVEEKKKLAEKARIKYHSDKEYREKKLLGMKEWAKNNPDKVKEYLSRREDTPKRRTYHAVAQAKYRDKLKALGLYKNYRGNRTEQTRRWLAKPENKIKSRAHHAVESAIEKGLLKKSPCEVCSIHLANAHHDDYNKPLEVRWLCTRHHYEHHQKLLSLVQIPISSGQNDI